jgi:hypothetical protein
VKRSREGRGWWYMAVSVFRIVPFGCDVFVFA